MRCETCDITLNSPAQARQHFAGKSHLRRLNHMAGGNKRNHGKTKEGGVGTKRKGDDPEDEASPIKSNKDDALESDGNSLKTSDKDNADQPASESPDNVLNRNSNSNNNIAKITSDYMDYNDTENLDDISDDVTEVTHPAHKQSTSTESSCSKPEASTSPSSYTDALSDGVLPDGIRMSKDVAILVCTCGRQGYVGDDELHDDSKLDRPID